MKGLPPAGNVDDAGGGLGAEILDELGPEGLGLTVDIALVAPTRQCNHCTALLLVIHFVLNGFDLNNKIKKVKIKKKYFLNLFRNLA